MMYCIYQPTRAEAGDAGADMDGDAHADEDADGDGDDKVDVCAY